MPRFFSCRVPADRAYADLPQTYMVSENENASVLKFGSRYYVKMKSTGKWSLRSRAASKRPGSDAGPFAARDYLSSTGSNRICIERGMRAPPDGLGNGSHLPIARSTALS